MRKFDEKDLKVGQVVKVKITSTYNTLDKINIYKNTFAYDLNESKTSIKYMMGMIFEDPEDNKLIISYFADSKDDVNYEKRSGFDSVSDLSISRDTDTTYEIVEVLEVGRCAIGGFDAEQYMKERNLSVYKQCYEVIYPTLKDRTHTIVIDDKEIEISEESYNKLKESLV